MLIVQFWAISYWASPKMMDSQKPMAQGELRPTLFCASWTFDPIWDRMIWCYVSWNLLDMFMRRTVCFIQNLHNHNPCPIFFACFHGAMKIRLANHLAELQLQRSQVVLRCWKHRKARRVRATRSCHFWLPLLLPSHCPLLRKLGRLDEESEPGGVFGNNCFLWFQFGDESKPTIITIVEGMNIQSPAILVFTKAPGVWPMARLGGRD